MRTCLINLQTGLVENVVEFGVAQLPDHVKEDTTPPEGFAYVADDSAGIGWSYANGQFTAPQQPPVEQQPPAPAIMTAAALADILIQKGVIQQTDADAAHAESATLFQGPAKKA